MQETQQLGSCDASQSETLLLENILNASWEDYYQSLHQLSRGFQLPECLKLLSAADAVLNQGNDITNSSQVERYLVGGVFDSQVEKHYGLSGSLLGDMQGFASFKAVLKKDPEGLAKLMKVVPATGPIDGWHFAQFIDSYKMWFADNGYKQTHLFPATRLLSMKRPDQFVALSEVTNSLVCQAFSIKPLKKQDFQRYWDEIILTIQKTKWYKAYLPMEAAEQPFHRVRVALLERLAATPVEFSNVELTPSIEINNEFVDEHSTDIQANNNSQESSNQLIQPERAPKVKKAVKQPKKMTITKRVTAKSNKTAATKLMSQYYFANKEKFAKVNLAKYRDQIIDRIVEGESVEVVFEELLNTSVA